MFERSAKKKRSHCGLQKASPNGTAAAAAVEAAVTLPHAWHFLSGPEAAAGAGVICEAVSGLGIAAEGADWASVAAGTTLIADAAGALAASARSRVALTAGKTGAGGKLVDGTNDAGACNTGADIVGCKAEAGVDAGE